MTSTYLYLNHLGYANTSFLLVGNGAMLAREETQVHVGDRDTSIARVNPVCTV